MRAESHVHGLWLIYLVVPIINRHCSAVDTATTATPGAAWLTTSSPQATRGSVMRFTCAVPVAWPASFQWFVDGSRVEADQFSPDRPFRIAVHHAEERAERAEELAYTVLEVRAERLKIGRVTCLVSVNGTGEQRRLRLSSPFLSSDGGRLFHFSHNASCTRQSQCVDGNSSCYADLTTQVRRCLCTRGYPFYSAPRASCLKHYAGLGARCVTDVDCQAGGEPNAVCGGAGRCVCGPSYSSEYRLGQCVHEAAYMGTCTSESVCSVEHSRCTNRTCHCYDGRRFDGSKCVPEVRSEGLRLRGVFFTLAGAFLVVSLLALVGTVVTRAFWQLVPLRRSSHPGHRRLVVRLL